MVGKFRIIMKKRAAADLEGIFNQIALDSVNKAVGFIHRILMSIENLSDFPHRNVVAGQPSDAKYPVRSLSVQSYLIFFRVVDDQQVVRILRVRHGARKQLKRFD
jgi:plasmid stabilization system protein ParE